MHLENGTRDRFTRFLKREFPYLVHRYRRLYAGKYPSIAYADGVRIVLETFRARYG